MNRISKKIQNQIYDLRLEGKSIPEIAKKVGVSKTTVTRYVKNIELSVETKNILQGKQGGAKERASGLRDTMKELAAEKIGVLDNRAYFFLLLGLYWGEGTKKDFGLINSDPCLIQTFLIGLQELGISSERVQISLRVHSDISVEEAKNYWANITGISQDRIGAVEVIEGKKKGKLKYGMCRVRVKSGIRERLVIQTGIELIGNEADSRLVS